MMAETTSTKRGVRKRRKGIVVSVSGDKFIVVLVERRKKHPRYSKVVKVTKKFHTHDEKNEAGVGDSVEIVECRPISRLKRWRLQKILAVAEGKG